MPPGIPPPSLARVSDRLDELHRQRATLQAHLDWLDREIAREKSESRDATPPSNFSGQTAALAKETSARTVASLVPATDASSADAESILAQFADSPQKIQTQVKRGCWTVFALALLIPALGVAAWYFLRAR